MNLSTKLPNTDCDRISFPELSRSSAATPDASSQACGDAAPRELELPHSITVLLDGAENDQEGEGARLFELQQRQAFENKPLNSYSQKVQTLLGWL